MVTQKGPVSQNIVRSLNHIVTEIQQVTNIPGTFMSAPEKMGVAIHACSAYKSSTQRLGQADGNLAASLGYIARQQEGEEKGREMEGREGNGRGGEGREGEGREKN